jgi:hypothetical protein
LQISRAELHPSIDVAEALSNAGTILREFIVGIEKLLQNRAELKTTFRLRDAVREVCQDLLAHQEAFLDAMTEAFVEFAERFDPEELTANFERSLGRKPLFRLLSEFKYWGLYKDLYPIMTERGGGRFPQMFAEEFVKAYERHIIESLREHRLSHTLPNVKLEPLSEEAFMAEQAAEDGPDGPSDQTEHSPDRAPGEVLENISDLSGLNELVDFDDLETQSDTVVFEDDAGQAKA